MGGSFDYAADYYIECFRGFAGKAWFVGPLKITRHYKLYLGCWSIELGQMFLGSPKLK